MNRLPLFFTLILTAGMASGQVVVNPDGTHSTVVGSVIVNPNGTHSTIHGSVVVNPNGTHSTIVNNTIVTPIPGTNSNPTPGTETNFFNTMSGSGTSAGPFQLTADGFINRKDKKTRYIVLKFPGKPKDELYTKTLAYLQSYDNDQSEVITSAAEESITFHTTNNQIPVAGYMNKFTLNYTLTMYFEDNRLLVEPPEINSITRLRSRNRITTVGISGDQYDQRIFSPKGHMRLKDTSYALDNVVNSFINDLGKNIKHNKY